MRPVLPRMRQPSRLLLLLFAACLPCSSCTSPSGLDETRAAKAITVATYNIKHGLGMDGAIDLERVARVLEALDADVIALQEIDQNASRSGDVDQADWLGRRLGMSSRFGSFMPFQGGRYGLALLTRFPIESHSVWRLTDGNEPRVALAVTLRPDDGAPFTVVVVHFDWVDDDGFRFTQAEETIEGLRSLDTPWVVIGDFNDTPGSRTIDAFLTEGRNVAKTAGAESTFPSDRPVIEIDFIITGPGDAWSTAGSTVIPETVASDHRPVIATIRTAE